jgi:hypothetical protein
VNGIFLKSGVAPNRFESPCAVIIGIGGNVRCFLRIHFTRAAGLCRERPGNPVAHPAALFLPDSRPIRPMPKPNPRALCLREAESPVCTLYRS